MGNNPLSAARRGEARTVGAAAKAVRRTKKGTSRALVTGLSMNRTRRDELADIVKNAKKMKVPKLPKLGR